MNLTEQSTKSSSTPSSPDWNTRPRNGKARAVYLIAVLLGTGLLASIIFRHSSYSARIARGQTSTQPNAQLGREIYIAEGCIHCHSQYARPGTTDQVQWGPPADPKQVLEQTPPLIGNRRQGPDLMNVGNRRSPEWQRVHLINPRSLVPASRMPSYAHLFAKGEIRGEALVVYLCSLGGDTSKERLKQIARWTPAPDARPNANSAAELYDANCSCCHGDRGTGDGPLAKSFGGKSKCDLLKRPTGSPATEPDLIRLAQIIKFGIPGTQMPGYETLTDSEVLGLASYVATSHQKGSTE